jgi:hypothetical protein
MAIKKMYALYDQTAQVFLNPVTFNQDGEAIRWFTTMANDAKNETVVSKYPEQFTLYRLADYDDSTGCYRPRDLETNGEPDMEPKMIIQGINIVNEETKYSINDLISLINEGNKTVLNS